MAVDMEANGPLYNECAANFLWQWGANTSSCVGALDAHGGGNAGPNAALAILQGGQSHNPHVQQVYNAGVQNLGEDFWLLVATVSDHLADFNDANQNLHWQFDNNLQSLNDSLTFWRAGNFYRAVVSVLIGQIHNPAVMSEYRACIGSNRDQFFGLLAAYLH